MRTLDEYIKEGLLNGDMSKVKADLGDIVFNKLKEINDVPIMSAGAKATEIVPEVIEMIQSNCDEIIDWRGDSKYFNKGTYAIIYSGQQLLEIFIKKKGEGRRNLHGMLTRPGLKPSKSYGETKDFYHSYKFHDLKLYKISDKQIDFTDL